MVASYELGGGWIHVATATVGKRAFLGNSGITQPGRRVPDDGLVAVLSAAPRKAKAGSSWLGKPPIRLRRKADTAAAGLTYSPSMRLKVMRSVVETCRLLPVMVTFAIGVAVLMSLQALAVNVGYAWAAVACGALLLVAGAVACGSAVAAVAHRRPDSGGREAALVVLCVAQRSLRHLCRNRCGAVVLRVPPVGRR